MRHFNHLCVAIVATLAMSAGPATPATAELYTGYLTFETAIEISGLPPSPAQYVRWETRCSVSGTLGESEVDFARGTSFSGDVLTTIETTGAGIHLGDAYRCQLVHLIDVVRDGAPALDEVTLASVSGTLPAQPATSTDLLTAPLSATQINPAAHMAISASHTHLASVVALGALLASPNSSMQTPAPTPPPSPKPTPTLKPAPSPTPKPAPASGKDLFAANCAACHGAGGGGTAIAPQIAAKGFSAQYVLGKLTNPPPPMMSTAERLSTDEKSAIARYVSQM